MSSCQTIFMETLDDPRLSAYRNLRERTLRGESIFIAEGHLVTERLLKSPYPVQSILMTAERFESESGQNTLLPLIPDTVPVYVVPEKTMLDSIVGFEFYQGILALGERTPLMGFLEGLQWLAKKGQGVQRAFSPKKPLFCSACSSGDLPLSAAELMVEPRAWVVLPRITKPDNLGLVFRSAAALNVEAVVLGEESCDPFSRRALRVSMGGVLQVPVFRSQDLAEEIRHLKSLRDMFKTSSASSGTNPLEDTAKATEETSPFDIEFCATLLDEHAESLGQSPFSHHKTAFLFGNEYDGLESEWGELCDRKMMIPMRSDVDSLNLGVSVGIFLYEFNRSRFEHGS